MDLFEYKLDDVREAHMHPHHRHFHSGIAKRRHLKIEFLQQQRQAIESEEHRDVDVHRRGRSRQDEGRVSPIQRAFGDDDRHRLRVRIRTFGRFRHRRHLVRF